MEQVDLRGWMGRAHPVELGREGRSWKAGGESRPLVGSDARGGQGVMALSHPALCAEGGNSRWGRVPHDRQWRREPLTRSTNPGDVARLV